MDRPSYQVRPGDVVTVREHVQPLYRDNPVRQTPAWLDVNADALRVTVLSRPSSEDVSLPTETARV